MCRRGFIPLWHGHFGRNTATTMLLLSGILYYVYKDWKLLWILCAGKSRQILANLGNQTVLDLFAMCRLNCNHFQTGRITTESWSRFVQGTRYLRTTPGMHTYYSFKQNGHSKSWFSNFKVVLNSTSTTAPMQCTRTCTFTKPSALHHSFFVPRIPNTKFTSQTVTMIKY